MRQAHPENAFSCLYLVFILHKSAQTLDTLERYVVFFHQFFQIVSFLRNEMPVAVRFRQPDDVTADDGMNGMELHDAVFAEVGNVGFVSDKFFPLIHMKSIR